MSELTLIVLAKLVLAAVFLLAGTMAFANRASFLGTLSAFRVPAWAQRPLATVLPALELAIGVAFLVPGLAATAALAALALLGSYTGVIGYALQAGQRPACNCFGQLSEKPIGAQTLVRNALFIMMCLLVFWGGGKLGTEAGEHRISFGSAVVVVLFALQGWLIAHLLGQHGRLILRMDNIELQLKAAGIEAWSPGAAGAEEQGLEVGTLAPEFQVARLADGQAHSLAQLRAADRPTVLLFSDAACGPCKELMPRVAEWSRRYGVQLAFAVITTGGRPGAENENSLAMSTFVQKGREAAELFRAVATPTAVVLSREGTIASTLAVGAGQIEKLVQAVAAAEGGRGPQSSPRQWQIA